MNWQNWLFWGVAATLSQTLFEGCSQGLRLTRMSLPFLVGTIFTSRRSKAKLFGFALHLFNGLLFTLVYIVAFHYLGGPTWWRGGLLGVAQATFVLAVGMTYIPEFHPRMASERYGPSAAKILEPPGFLALNYGPRTPISILLSHIVFGVVIGSFCHA